MPLAKKTTKPMRRARRVPRPPRSIMSKKKYNTGEFASLSCTRTLTVAPPATNATVTDTMFSFDDFKLSDFPRAVQVAQGYQHYRITGIKLTFKPAYDTYQQNAPGGGANTQKPFLYYMIDKAAAIPDNVTLEGLKNMGARPRAFKSSPLSVTWRPSVLNLVDNGQNAGTIGTSYRISPWLNTAAAPLLVAWAPSEVPHRGIFWYMEQPGAGVGETTVYVEVELQFQFKKPLIASMVGATSARRLEYPKLDLSPDGIEGGSDGITIPIVNV